MIYVDRINWISHESKDAILSLRNDKNCMLNCFCSPCENIVLGEFKETLYVLNQSNTYIVYDDKEENIAIQHDKIAHRIVAKVKNIDEKSVIANGFEIILEYLPGDVSNDDMICFFCSRIDSY